MYVFSAFFSSELSRLSPIVKDHLTKPLKTYQSRQRKAHRATAKQLGSPGKGRKSSAARTRQLVICYQTVIPENIYANNKIQTEKVAFRNIHICTHAEMHIIINEKNPWK